MARTPSPETHDAILRATAALLASTRYAAITFDRIAEEARVGKAAIFRRWDSKAALAAEALRRMFETANPALPATGEARRDVRMFVRNTVHMLTRTPAGLAIRNIVSELEHEPELAKLVADLEAERKAMIQTLLAPFAPKPRDRAALMSLLFGPIYFRWLVTREPIDNAFVDRCVDVALEKFDAR